MKNRLFLCTLLFSLSTLTFSQLVEPVKSGLKYGFTVKNAYIEVNTGMGSRVSSLKLDNKEIMYVDWNNALLAGSTFWPSPQGRWGWPPSEILDSDPYTVEINGNKLITSSEADDFVGLQFTKTIYADEADTSITLEYTMANTMDVSQEWAPWEVTRVPDQGLTFFGKGLGDVTGDMADQTSESNGCVWYDEDNNTTDHGSKFFCDGKGWLAHVNPSGQIFIKVFKDIAYNEAADGEAEVEVFTNSGLPYTELEDQGAMISIPAFGTYKWIVKWYLRNLPDNIVVNENQQLADYAANFAKRTGTFVRKSSSLASEINVFPNPAKDFINIRVENSNGFNLKVYDLSGKEVLQQVGNTAITKINIQHLEKGCYFYEVENKGEGYRGKFVIIK